MSYLRYYQNRFTLDRNWANVNSDPPFNLDFIGRAEYRSFVPIFHYDNNPIYSFITNYRRPWYNVDYSDIFSNILNKNIRPTHSIEKEFDYSNYSRYYLKFNLGVIYEMSGNEAFIHLLITKNTHNNEYFPEDRRYFMSRVFMYQDKYKYLRNRLFKELISIDQSSSLCITDNIIGLFYENTRFPKFENLEDRIAFEDSLTENLITETEILTTHDE